MEHDSGFDPATRRLCPDGSCIGVLGADGTCGECGRRSDGSAVDPAPGSLAAGHHGSDDGSSDPGVAAGTEFDPNRRLCEDGTCVGVIGANGACTVCGRVAG